ncbi:GNAT family N-acetyltransferase [Bacillus sp. FJAT-42376]|uniref:GNAT family N-acetyltransferase n=1 Tax=Bacillus sp. FJAT-42376 TaxID=2014076 RepID=UPI000F4FDFE9|nr:GNAT family N-acetyltransferase [Bacillus sp. FJAT-42376]AZB41791.1 GNAT family N-acetyltransferase [Bacillus sp. FJAT-42376]
MQLIIRPSQKKDMQQLMELDRLIWNSTNTPALLHWDSVEDYEKSYPEGQQMVAAEGDRIAGYISFKHPFDVPSNRHVFDLAIGIHPDFQGKKVGSRLMEHLRQIAREQGVRKISLRVLSTNEKAIAFYKAIGFKEEGRLHEEFFLDGKYVDDLLLYKMVD